MKLENFFSLKDYFNYYISGLLWCLSGLFLAKDSLSKLFSFLVSTTIETGGLVALSIVLLFVPYVVGFTLMPLSKIVIPLWHGKGRRHRPDPREYLLMTEGISATKESRQFEGARVKLPNVVPVISRLSGMLECELAG